MSASCEINATATVPTLPTTTLQGSVSFQLHPCNTADGPIQLVLSGNLSDSGLGEFTAVTVTRMGQVAIEREDKVVGYLHVLDLILGWSQANEEAVYVAIAVSFSIHDNSKLVFRLF